MSVDIGLPDLIQQFDEPFQAGSVEALDIWLQIPVTEKPAKELPILAVRGVELPKGDANRSWRVKSGRFTRARPFTDVHSEEYRVRGGGGKGCHQVF